MPLPRLLAVSLAASLSLFGSDLEDGLKALNRGHIQEARELLIRAVHELYVNKSADMPSLVSALCGLADTYHFTGEFQEAEGVLKPLLNRWNTTKDVRMIPALNSMAALATQQSRWEEAFRLATSAYTASVENYGPQSQVARTAALYLASMYVEQGQFDKALPILTDALKFARAAKPLDEVEVAAILMSIGKANVFEQHFDIAFPALREAFEIANRVGNNPMLTAQSSFSLAAAYIYAGYPERAEPLLRTSMSRTIEAMGPDSRMIASVLVLQGHIAATEHRWGEAERDLTRVVTMLPAGTNLAERAVAELKLADIYVSTNRCELAKPILSADVERLRRIYQGPHPQIAAAYIRQGECAEREHDNATAIRMYREAIAMFKQLPSPNASFAYALNRYAKLIKPAQREQAREAMAQAKDIERSFKAAKMSNALTGY